MKGFVWSIPAFSMGILIGIYVATAMGPTVAPVELLMQGASPWRGDAMNWSWEEAGRTNSSVAVLELKGNVSAVAGGVVYRPWTCHDWDGRRLCLAYDGWWVPRGSMNLKELMYWSWMAEQKWMDNDNETRRWAEMAGRGGLS